MGTLSFVIFGQSQVSSGLLPLYMKLNVRAEGPKHAKRLGKLSVRGALLADGSKYIWV